MTATQATETTATVTPATEAPKTTARRPSRASRGAPKAAAPKATGKAAPKATAPKATAPKAKTAPLPKVQITAPKGGTQTVAPRKGAIAKAIKASGSSLMAISRDHGLNPSQLRRLSLDQVAKVDLVRAEAIAKALGVKLDNLFGAPEDKTAPKAKATAKAE